MNDDLQRFYQAMAILRQKIETLRKSTPSLCKIIDLKEIPADKRENVENQLWEIFTYGEYYVKKIISELLEKSIVSTSKAGRAHFDYYNGKYKRFIKVTENLIDVSNAPTRKEAEQAIIFAIDDGPARVLRDYWKIDITEYDIAQYFAADHEVRTTADDEVEEHRLLTGYDYQPVLVRVAERDLTCSGMDCYAEIALNGWLQNHIRNNITDSGENAGIKTCFRNMLEIVKNLQAEIEDSKTRLPEMIPSKRLDGPRIGEISEKEHKNERLAYDLRASDYEKIIKKPYFKPDEWIANEEELSPIFVTQEPKQIPGRIRDRIDEIRNSFIFGHWMSVIALSRSLLEYAIIDRKSLLEKRLKKKIEFHDNQRTKNIRYLISVVEEAFSELGDDMDFIVEQGHRVMHNTNVSSICSPNINAKLCIVGIVKIISTLYSEPNNS